MPSQRHLRVRVRVKIKVRASARLEFIDLSFHLRGTTKHSCTTDVHIGDLGEGEGQSQDSEQVESEGWE